MSFKQIGIIASSFILVGLLSLVLVSCASPLDYAFEEVDMDAVETAPDEFARDLIPEAEYMMEEQEMIVAESGLPDLDVRATANSGPSLRHVIQRGSIELTVSDTRDKLEEIQEIVRKADGLIASLYVYEIREGQYGARVTLRVPDAKFNPVLEQLEALGKANNIQTELEDITMQYVDLESRLKNQQAQEERLTEILEMADTVEDVLEVEKELNRVRGEVESMTARLNQLKDQVTFATINVSLREETIPTGTVTTNPFQNLGTRIAEAFIGSINFLLTVFSGLIVIFTALLPAFIVLLLLAAIIWLIVRRYTRKKARSSKDNAEESGTLTHQNKES